MAGASEEPRISPDVTEVSVQLHTLAALFPTLVQRRKAEWYTELV
jgi:hypothetical protein